MESISLPKNWTLESVDTIIRKIPLTGKKLKARDYEKNGNFPVIDQGQEFIGGYTNRKNLQLQCDLPVIVFGDHTKIIKFVDFNFVAGADGIKVIQPIEVFNSKLFYYFLRVIELPHRGYSRHFKFLEESYIPIPPLEEQKRIVSKIEDLFKESKSTREALDKILQIMKKFRQSILEVAFKGNLVPQDPNDESVEKLIIRIREERNKRLDDGKSKKEQHNIELDDVPALPKGWIWIRAGELIESMKNGLYKPENFYGKGTRCLRMYNIENGKIVLRNLKEMILTKEEIEEYGLLENDILLNRVNTRELVGKSAIIPPNFGKLVFESKNIRVRVWKKLLEPAFLSHFLYTTLARDQIESGCKQTVGMATVSQSDINKWLIPFAPLQEQKRIIKKIKQLYNFADQIEKSVEEAKKRADKIDQAILVKAFRGELVQQDPNDEPASVLLERVKSKKEKTLEVKPIKKIKRRTT